MAASRAEVLDYLRHNPDVSVLVIGAGVNGIGVFREIAMQGVDVLLVDKMDFCGGASAASSHMAHGGLRYLENGEFRLVREALRERNLLLQNAPHYVKPLPTTIPIFRWFSGILNAPLKFLRLRDKPSERGAFIIKVGLLFYDLFTLGQQTLPRHRFASRKKSLKQYPHLNPNIICTATYYDAWMPTPERLCMELVMDTESLCSHARSLNYMPVTGADGDTVYLTDELTDEQIAIKPKLVVNAAGPWIDFVNQKVGKTTRFIGGTKGSHLVLDHYELHSIINGREFFFENKDGRICLIFPLEDKVLVGTTDIRIDDPETAVCTEDEVDYMLNLVKHVFPSLPVDRSHIVFQFSGVRPLPYSDASSPGQISRDHSIEVIPASGGLHFPIYSLVGGKWTTFRAFAEKTTDTLLEALHRPRLVDTHEMAIGGGKQYPKGDLGKRQWVQKMRQQYKHIGNERILTLFDRYGTYAETLLAFAETEEDRPLQYLSNYTEREILFLIHHEKVIHLDDLILRRSLIGMLGLVTKNLPLLEELSDLLASGLGWSEDRRKSELDRTITILKEKHGLEIW